MKNMQLRMLIIATTTADESDAMMNDERNILRRFDGKMMEKLETALSRGFFFLKIWKNILQHPKHK